MGKIEIGKWKVSIIKKIEQKRKEYDNVDKDGSVLTTEFVPSKKVYKNKDGVIVENIYKLINGKPFGKLKKTTEVEKFEEVPKIEVYDLITESFYFCECDKLRDYLAENDTALKFIYTNGNGYKAYQSYLIPFGKHLILYCGFGSLTEQIKAIAEAKGEIVEIKEEVARANPEELLVA